MSDQDNELLALRQENNELRSANVNITAARDGYKKIALQTIQDLKYIKSASPSSYVDRRYDEVQKEVAAVPDQA